MKWDFIEALEWQGMAEEDVHKTAYERGAELARSVKSEK